MMLLTRNLNRLLFGFVWVAMLGCFFLAPAVVRAEVPPSRWPRGWSQPVSTGTATFVYRHETAVVGQYHLWMASVNTSGQASQIELQEVDLRNGQLLRRISIPLNHLLKGFALASTESGVLLTWLERDEGVRSTLLAAYIDPNSTVAAPRLLWESADPAENPQVAIDEEGLAHIVFTSAALGMHAVQILSVDLTGPREPRLSRVSSPDYQARLPVLAVRDGYLHLAYYRQSLIGAWAHYQAHEADTHRLVVEASLGMAPTNYPYRMVLLSAPDYRVRLVWQRMTGTLGRVNAGAAVMGTLFNGLWEEPLSPVDPAFRGRIAAVRAVANEQGEILTTWLAEAGRTWQVYAVRRTFAGEILQRGFATMAQGNVLGPDPQWAGALGIVSYMLPQGGGQGAVSYVHTAEDHGEPWYFRAGLDPHSPLSDAIFKYFTLLIGAIGLAFMGLGALMVSIAVISVLARYGVFSSSSFGQLLRFLLQFLLLMGLKRPHSLFYYGAQFLPGWGSILSFALAAAVALIVIYLTDLDVEDWPALGITGIAFIATDAFVTLGVLGVGLW
ncbi:MAG: hypothetical protein KGZ92_09470 [Firmicutes bacterium]|nr:hypothetical protein [Dethiobacter sp.]MBS3889490.1 hypothetical protein [Bacillota bacterium]